MTRHTLPPAFTAMSPSNPHGLRYVEGEDGTGDNPPAPKPTPPPAAGSDAPAPSGFPPDTAWRDMDPAQQVAYWQHQARKHEKDAKARGDYEQVLAERDELRRKGMSESQQAVEEARRETRAQVQAEERAAAAARLVAAEFRLALAGKRTADEVALILEPLDPNRFLAPSGEVDTDKVTQYAAGIAGGQKWPDMGQGNRGTGHAPKGVGSGRDLYATARGKK